MIFFLVILIVSLILLLFFFISGKASMWHKDGSMSFECGFSSYFFSHFSFSIHFFKIGLIFLVLDLELCYIMPYFNLEKMTFKVLMVSLFFLVVLLLGLMEEYRRGDLDWKF